MEITLHKRVKEEKPNNCKAIITTSNIPPNSPISYFLSISIPQPKVKIKVPKLIVKAMQSRTHGSCTDSNADDQRKKKKKNMNKRKWARTPRKLKRVASIFSNVFSYKKSSSENKCWSSNNVGNFAESNYDGETENGFENDDPGSVKTSSSSENSLQIFVDRPISKSCSLKDILKIEDDQQGKKKKIQSLTGNSSHKSSLSFSSFFSKRSSFNFNKGKNIKTRASGVNDGGIGSASFSVNGKPENSCSLTRVNEVRIVRKGKFTGTKSKKHVEEQREKEGEIEERGDDELCKKRILMGEKCKPLNASGALHYDKNGVLLPEHVIP